MQDPASRSGFVRGLFAVMDMINRLVGYAMAAALAVMVVFTLLQVMVRFLLTKFGILMSVPWTEEMARYLMIWIVFLGSAIACRKGQLIALEFLVDAAPEPFGRILRVCALAISLVFFAMLVWLGWHYVTGNFIERSPVMQIRMSWVYVSLPIGAVLMVVNTLCLAIEEMHGRHRPAETYVD